MMNDVDDDAEKSLQDQGRDGEQTTDDVYRSSSFDNKDFVSKPIKSDRCTIDENVIRLHHSFGYDCRSKMFNICAADDRTVVYAAGNYIGTFDVNDGVSSFRKCAGNGGIGHIAKNPIFGHLAVGENGCGGDDDGALIIVYEWPTFGVVSVLRGSAERQNKWLTYNQNGQLLCSQAGEPDNTLTIWDWEKSVIVLRTESHTRDVYVCRFSTFVIDQLVTAGSGHVKFWKMANTFTGLKLKGRLGRFGKMQTSDIIGIFSMPDEKVVSGCDWGNILVWDEDVVDVQVMRKGRKPCHSAPIIMFLYSEHNAELTSVSMDGTIKFWYYRTVDTADPADNDDRVIEMEPSFTINVQDSIGIAKIMGMCKVNNDPSSNDYFVQDGNGGMWLTDIEVSAKAKPLRRLAKFHGDEITSLQTSPVGYFIATTSLDGWFHVYDVANRKLMFTHNFNVPITSSIWLPLNIASSGNVFIIGFQTGILKIVAVPFKEIIKEKKLFDLVKIQSSKPHTDSIRHLTVNCNAKIVVCGSDDCSIFVYKINTDPVKLNPIGMYLLPGKITFIHWKPSGKDTALISCASGHIVEVNVPTSRPSYTTESFLLKLESRVVETVSVRHRVLRDQHMLDIERKEEKIMDRKKKRLEIIKEKKTYAEIVEDLNFEDSNKDKGPPKIDVPATSNPVLFAIYTPSERTLWVSIDGYGAGFLYEYDFDSPEPINATMIPNKNNISLTTIKMFGTDSLKVLMGFADGRIRVTNIKAEDIHDLNDYIEYAVHDNKTGRVKTISSSHDDRMLFTYGDDGNIFSFMFQCDNDAVDACMNSIFDLPRSSELVEEDIIKTKEDLKISLEERKINKEKRKALNLANKEKDKIRCSLYGLKERFKQVLLHNESLPESLRFSHDYFQFDERFNRSLIEEAQSKMDKLHLKLVFDYEKSLLGLTKVKNYFVDKIITAKFEVKAISKDARVKTIYHKVHYNLFEILLDEFLSKKPQRRSTILERTAENPVHKITESEIFLRNIREIYPTLPKKIQSSIDKFAARIEFENQEILKIKNMYNEKPIDNTIEENATLSNAWKTIGDLNLKTATDFKLSDDVVISLEDKFKQYMSVRKEIHDLKSNFNEKVFNLRQHKIKLINDYKQFKFDTDMIRNELNDSELTTPADFPEVLIDDSIDPNITDRFEPQNHRNYSDPMYLFLSNLYDMEMSENEERTSMKTTMRQLRRSHLKHRHECLHESMLTKINIFDDHLLALDAERKNVKIHITFLDLFALTLEKEIIILNDFDSLEDENLDNVRKKTMIQNEKINQIMMDQKHIANYNEIINNNLNKLIDIEHTFDMEVRNNNFAKYLKYIFKKKLKIHKVKSYNDDNDDVLDSLSSSSSDENDESEPETDKDLTRDSLTTMNRFTMLDENVLPVGCDPKLFALTFELRSQRHAIEQSTENIKKMAQLSNKSLSLAYAELNAIENDLKENLDQLETYRIKKLLKLNQVEVTVLLNKSQMCKSQLQNSSVLVNGNVMQVLANRVTELKKETEDINHEYKSEKLNAKQLRTEINAMEQVLKNYKVAIRDEMMKKFRIETDWSFLDDMEMAIINYMIVQAKSRPEETKERFIKETKLLENQIRINQDILTDLIEANTIKTLTLKSLFESIRQLQQDLSLQPKNYETFQNMSANNANKDDMVALKNVYDMLAKRKWDICTEINALKYKGKMFPPIAARRPRPSVTGQRDDDGRPTTLGRSTQDEETTCSLDRVSEEEKEESSYWTTSDDGEDEERRYYEMEFNVEPRATTVSKRSSAGQWSSWVEGGEKRDDGWAKYDDENMVAEDFEETETTFEGTRNEVGFDECRSSENNDYVQPRDDGNKSSQSSG